MEASLRISATPEPKLASNPARNSHARVSGTAQARDANNAPKRDTGARASSVPSLTSAASVSLPLRFIVTGLLALFSAIVVLVARPTVLSEYHYNQYVIATTHLFVLGFITSVVMGAMYQLVPVALETKLHSERLAKWQFAFHVIGFTGMVFMFWTWNMKQLGHFGSVMGVSVGMFVYNLARTLRRVPKWNVTATAVAAALGWISFTVAVGLAVVAAKCSYDSEDGLATATGVNSMIQGLQSVGGFMRRFAPISAMHAHAHLGGVGFFTLLIVGVSYKLIPMFTLSELQNKRRAALSVALLNIGLAGSFITILLRSPLKFAFTLVIVAAIVVYGIELTAILRARKRAALDWGIKTFLVGVTLLIPLSIISLVLAWPTLPMNQVTAQLENLYGFIGFIGVVTLAIIGMLYKIVPFLVWFGVYSPHVGRAKLPPLGDMYSVPLQIFGFWSFLAGLAITSGGIMAANNLIVRIGCVVLFASVVSLVVNVGKILLHFARPQIMALPVKTK